jgi:hypothetical protein
MKPKYLELAEQQFLNLKEEVLDMNRKAVGSEDETNYDNEGVKFKIKVHGFWERSDWFDYWVFDEQNTLIEQGHSDL